MPSVPRISSVTTSTLSRMKRLLKVSESDSIRPKLNHVGAEISHVSAEPIHICAESNSVSAELNHIASVVNWSVLNHYMFKYIHTVQHMKMFIIPAGKGRFTPLLFTHDLWTGSYLCETWTGGPRVSSGDWEDRDICSPLILPHWPQVSEVINSPSPYWLKAAAQTDRRYSTHNIIITDVSEVCCSQISRQQFSLPFSTPIWSPASSPYSQLSPFM